MLDAIRTSLGAVIRGKPEVLDLLLVAVLGAGHVLMEDVPGLLGVIRLYLAQPVGGHAITVAMALLALIACGMTQSGAVYAGLTASFVAASVSALHRFHPERPLLAALDRRRRLAAVGAALVAMAAGAALAHAAPHVHHAMLKALLRLGRDSAVSSFSEQIHLGSTTNIAESDAAVLRLRGPRVD